MGSQHLVSTAIIAASFGLFALFIISLFSEPAEVRISELQNAENGNVMVRGVITGISLFESHAIMKIAEIKEVDAVVFDRKLLESMTVGQNVTITGRIQDYKGKKELVAERMRPVSQFASG